MAEMTPDLGNFAYIPLSGLVILLVILLTCASRRKKIDAFSTVEQNFENDIKEEYAIMCFPCLKKKPDLGEYEPTEDLTNQFEYIVEKYTIRKVPLLLANTTEDLLERQKELEIAKSQKNQSQMIDDNTVNFKISQEVYNVQKIPPCITFGASTSYRGSKSVKERPMPSDILESMSPVTRPPIRNHNYVAIPTKASLRHKDIMMTKREITNQYLNNFSSVFVDNLKDQVPKDPEQFPHLSRPYTSAFKNFPINSTFMAKSGRSGKKSKKCRGSKIAYAYPLEETNMEETSFSGEVFYDSDLAQEQRTDCCEFQEDTENESIESVSKSKSLVLVCDSKSAVIDSDNLTNPFKTILKPTPSSMKNYLTPPTEKDYRFSVSFHKEEWPNTKNVTYDDIQALDVGYEFTSCEKLGVKPKMTRIHHSLESENLKEFVKLGVGDSQKFNKDNDFQEQAEIKLKKSEPERFPVKVRSAEDVLTQATNTLTLFPTQMVSSKSVVTETSFLPNSASVDLEQDEAQNKESLATSIRSDDSKSRSINEADINSDMPTNMADSFTLLSKLSKISRQPSTRTNLSKPSTKLKEGNESDVRFQASSKSRSFDNAGFSNVKKEKETEVKGKDNLPYPNPNTANKVSRLNETDTETTYSLDSRESKMSSVMTSTKSSEVDEDKRATLRWKIIIKHHREDNSSRRCVNMNKKN